MMAAMMTLGRAVVPVVVEYASAGSVPSDVHVSSRSTWSDRRWVLDGRRPGLVEHDLIVDWSFDLPDGSCFTDPQWAPLLEAARRYLWTLSTDPPPGRSSTRSMTLINVFNRLRLLIRWMVKMRYTRFADLDRDAAERFLATVAERNGRKGKPLAPTTKDQYARLLQTLYQQRNKLPDAPREHPFGGERFGLWTGLQAALNPLPYTPDAIAVPLISAALRLIGQPAEDVIALRDRVQPIYQGALDQGWQHHAARRVACASARTFEFATLDNEEAPWHAPAVSTKRVRFLVERIYDACFVTIAYLVGARVSEIISLEVGCIERHASADGSETFAYLCGRIYKTAPGPEGDPHRWVAPAPVVRAVEVLERLSEPLRRRTGRPELWLGMPGHGIVESRAVKVPSVATMTVRLNRHFAPFIGLPPHRDGRPWHLTTHQGRKTFARFVGRRDRTGLHALQAHYGHVSRIMTDRAYVGTDFDLAELIDAQAMEETRAALEELLTATRLAGKGGHQIAARSPFRGRTRDGDVQQYVEFILTESDMRLGACDWGYCVYRRESSACLGDDRDPNPALRTENTCITCANFAVTDRHRPVWETRWRRNLDLLAHPMLDEESRTLAQTRIAECERVLAALDAGPAGDRDAI
jgi:integrase